MKLFNAVLALLAFIDASVSAIEAEETNTVTYSPSVLSHVDVQSVAPALDKYARDRLLGEVWKRPGLAARDRSLVTLAALIARNQSVELPFHISLALDNGVKPAEIFGDYHASRFLCGMGECSGSRRGGEGCVCRAQNWRGPAARRIPGAAAAQRSRGGGPCKARRGTVRCRISRNRSIHHGCSVS